MGRGTYIGGGTLVGFGHDVTRKAKDSPASRADLAAGDRLRAALEAERQKKRAETRARSAANREEEARLAHVRAQERKKRKELKEQRRKAHEAAHKAKQLQKQLRAKAEAERKADPTYLAELRRKAAARGQMRMAGVVVERRSHSGRTVVARGVPPMPPKVPSPLSEQDT
jgi:chromosome segregation ATPase